jgi:uncharacterized protein YkwD
VWKAVAGLVVPAVLAAPAPASAFASPEAELMSRIVTQTNQVRHAHGCGQLEVDHELVEASVRQSDYMADTRTFSHIGRGGSTFVARARAAGYTQPAGENIAWGFDTADEVMDAWMASPPHRRNILNCAAQAIGTGVRYASDGTAYYTQVFGWR